MSYTLQSLSYEQLQALAASQVPTEFAARAAPGALPPYFVAARALKLLDDGQSVFWCSSFIIVRTSDQRIVGGCGFKSTPQNGRVEIGYGIAAEHRRQGIASAAVNALLELAFHHGAIEVLAEILPDNIASIATVKKAGFRDIGSRIAEDNETVIQWIATHAAKISPDPDHD
ncbi:GNAT family N-acetyltransferase [Undibacterium flavidum]|uniref:GNAT family N-acetyltransferase n=1 Tax=Undibacterium flavidum TaxID=2762297 RepID=A0ABR6YG38_9BURK|nr:GNAT family N-acetyltransferase [Undibacterium flavidum]MBC3875536.1 GNAT family N-acetyltransferase [Undibacterium flavidum]